MYQFALWLTRSRALREFRYKHGIDGATPAGETWGDMFIAVARACSRVWNDDLVKFWRKGTLVVNEEFDWPWDLSVPIVWQVSGGTEKRYILSASPGQSEAWSLEAPVDVWALALLYDDCAC